MTDRFKGDIVSKPNYALAVVRSELVERGLSLARSLFGDNNQHLDPIQIATKTPIEFDWVIIPAGEFLMGSDVRDNVAWQDERPQHKVHLDEFYIARVPVTNSQYQAFVDAAGQNPPSHWEGGKIPNGKENHPVVNVSWNDAATFCMWAGVRLPTEAEWEKASRGPNGRMYPWGDQRPDKTLCNFNVNVGNTTPVGSYPNGASPYGVLDMAGNVLEWAADWYDSFYYSVSPARNPIGQVTGTARVWRGGSWDRNGFFVRAANRDASLPDYLDDYHGFRCARSK